MVHITEMRVPLPMTVEEFKRGQRYANWKTNESNTTEGQGGQLVSSAPYVSEIWGEGIFTHSLYRLGDRLPDWLDPTRDLKLQKILCGDGKLVFLDLHDVSFLLGKMKYKLCNFVNPIDHEIASCVMSWPILDTVTKLVPASALVIDEKTWMAFPHIRSVLTVPFFHKLKIEIISMHEDDDGSSENILGLSDAELTIRKVDIVDIAIDKVQRRDYQEKLDPQLFSSKRTGRGPLQMGWQNTTFPIMCAYKLVRVEANYWGVQNRLEKLMLNGVRQIVLLTHRNAFGYIDDWFDLTFEQICAWEIEGRRRLKAVVKQLPLIDPNTGLEFMIEGGNNLSQGTESVNGEDSDMDLEFFEAMMEWSTQDAEEFGEGLISGVPIVQSNWELLGVSNRCALCEARTKSFRSAEVGCETCNEVFCQQCFSEFHVTPRLRGHVTQYSTGSNSLRFEKTSIPEGSSINKLEERADQEVSSSCLTVSSSLSKDDTAISQAMALHLQQVQLTKGVELRLSHHRDPSWLEELNSSSKDTTSKAPLSKVKSKSSYRILNSLPDYSFQDTEELVPLSISGKKSTVRPNELSEQMVRSILLLYYHDAEAGPQSSPPHNSRQCLPHVRKRSRSHSFVEPEQQLDTLIGKSFLPYEVEESADNRVYSNCLAVTTIPDGEKHGNFEGYRQYRSLVEHLQHVDPRDMAHEQRLAFWINVYNSLMMHAYMVRGIPRNHYKRIAVMNKSAYIIGGHVFSALAIEHSILRACSYRPALVCSYRFSVASSCTASLLPVQKYNKHDARKGFALDRPEPLVSFALCCGSHSSPMVRVYTASNIRAELQLACGDYLSASVGLTRSSRIKVPKILHWYARDFSRDARSLLDWINQQLPEEKRAVIEECLSKRRGKKTSQQIAIAPYDWSFRYLFERTQDV